MDVKILEQIIAFAFEMRSHKGDARWQQISKEK
jgi:hypothetical protein